MDTQVQRIKEKLKKRHIGLSTVISEEDIRSFERKNKIQLPKEIVLFYTRITNGCQMIDGFHLYSFEEWKYSSETISSPFPYETYVIWEEELHDRLRYSNIKNGSIEVIDIGDAQTWNIIVAGQEHGRMWNFTEVGIQPAAPSMNFLEWFEYWLDGNEDYFKDFVY